MTENSAPTPYVIQIDEPIQAIHLSEELNGFGIQLDPNTQFAPLGTVLGALTGPQMLVESAESPVEIVQEATEPMSQNFEVINKEEHPCIVQIVYPQHLCLNPAPNIAKRGRPKKKKTEEVPLPSPKAQPEVDVNPPKLARTRSGRVVKLPRHIEKHFKKIEVNTENQEVQVSDFKRCEEKENTKVELAELQTKKRVISSRYKCPKCLKAYLGKNKMKQHLKKYPDHGPLPEGCQEFNFDVWNYLFDITQKCKPGQRGTKFCEELSNLLHNVQLLKSALFKTVTDNENCVHIDKVLGSAIGLPPGKYNFDENELYKDVTVLKLISNGDFFKPNNVNNSTGAKHKCKDDTSSYHSESKRIKQDVVDNSEDFTGVSDNSVQNGQPHSIEQPTDSAIEITKNEENVYDFTPESAKPSSEAHETNIADTFSKKIDLENQILPPDLLAENLLLQSLPNPRNSVDDLMLASVDNGSTLLDNSTSSDEVMNVDQFVNERFKKIIGPDIELGNASLNLDLPSLELFQFHTS